MVQGLHPVERKFIQTTSRVSQPVMGDSPAASATSVTPPDTFQPGTLHQNQPQSFLSKHWGKLLIGVAVVGTGIGLWASHGRWWGTLKNASKAVSKPSSATEPHVPPQPVPHNNPAPAPPVIKPETPVVPNVPEVKVEPPVVKPEPAVVPAVPEVKVEPPIIKPEPAVVPTAPEVKAEPPVVKTEPSATPKPEPKAVETVNPAAAKTALNAVAMSMDELEKSGVQRVEKLLAERRKLKTLVEEAKVSKEVVALRNEMTQKLEEAAAEIEKFKAESQAKFDKMQTLKEQEDFKEEVLATLRSMTAKHSDMENTYNHRISRHKNIKAAEQAVSDFDTQNAIFCDHYAATLSSDGKKVITFNVKDGSIQPVIEDFPCSNFHYNWLQNTDSYAGMLEHLKLTPEARFDNIDDIFSYFCRIGRVEDMLPVLKSDLAHFLESDLKEGRMGYSRIYLFSLFDPLTPTSSDSIRKIYEIDKEFIPKLYETASNHFVDKNIQGYKSFCNHKAKVFETLKEISKEV